MGSKQNILEAIRRTTLPAAALPSLEQNWTAYADRRQQFVEMLESVGGRVKSLGANRVTAPLLGKLMGDRLSRTPCTALAAAG